MSFESPIPDEAGNGSIAVPEVPLVHRPKNIAQTSPNDTKSTANGVNGDDREFLSHTGISLSGLRQEALLLHKAGEYYSLEGDREIPEPKSDAELLVQVLSIGLNPVDWKGADFDFGQPSYPWINGRDFTGVVIRAPRNRASRIQLGDVVFSSSTDYRDIRKAAFQEYVIANDYNVSRLSSGTSVNEGASLGVAMTAAVVALGVCFGLDFSQMGNIPKCPNFFEQLRLSNANDIPEDIREEVLNGISAEERPQPGEWIVIWGAGVVGQFFLQLAKLAGLKVACVEDLTLNGAKLATLGLDFMIDFKAYDPDRIVDILHAVTGGKLRFGVDTVGKKTAESLQKLLQRSQTELKAHLAGLSGLPEEAVKGVVHHKQLPLKLFHELPGFGEGISKWFEDLLLAKSLIMPDLEFAQGGLSGINDALDRLRKGEASGKRIVVPVRNPDGSPIKNEDGSAVTKENGSKSDSKET